MDEMYSLGIGVICTPMSDRAQRCDISKASSIDAISYEKILANTRQQLKTIDPFLEYSVLLIFDTQDQLMLSSFAYNIETTTRLPSYRRIDSVFNPTTYTKNHRITAIEKRDYAEQWIDTTFIQVFNIHNVYSIKRQSKDCCLIASVSYTRPIDDPIHIYQTTRKPLEDFLCNLMDQLLPSLMKHSPLMQFVDFVNCKTIRDRSIYNEIPQENIYLTQREKFCLYLTGKGFLHKQVANILCIGKDTVKNHLEHIRIKIGAKNTTHASHLSGYQSLLKK